MPFCYSFDTIPESVTVAELGKKIFFRTEKLDEFDRVLHNRQPHVAYLSCGQAGPPLVIRSWRGGDSFHPLGLGGRKKIKDFFVDHKIPKRLRRRVPIMLFGDRVAWVCGYRIDDRFKVTDETKRILRVDIQ